MTAFVEMSEEEIARRWLNKNSMAAVDWKTLERVMSDQAIKGIVIFDASVPTYRLKET